MTNKEINYNELFNLFIGNDEFRQYLNHPYKQGNRYYATDATAMIFMPCSVAELQYFEQDEPQTDNAIPKEKTMSIEISIAELQSKLIPEIIDEEIEKINETKCPECEGAGEIKIEYTEKTGKQIPNPLKKYKMLDAVFFYWQIERLIKAAKIVGCDTVIKTFGTPNRANVFQLENDITVLVMPLLVDLYSKQEIQIII